MSLDKFALERALAYQHLRRWIDKYKSDYAEDSEFADLKLARALVIEKDGDSKFISPREMQAALILYNIVTIEACIETGEASEIFRGETNLTHLLRSLKTHISVLTKLTSNEFIAPDYIENKFLIDVNNKIFSKREKQYELILNEIKALGYDKMHIPDGGKSEIKKACLTKPQIFFSDDSFIGAWKDGRKLDLFKIVDARLKMTTCAR